MFLTKVESRRQVTWRFKSDRFLKHLNYLGQAECENVPHGDTLKYSMSRVQPEALSGLREKMVKRILRMRCLEQYRLLGRYWLVAIDGTGQYWFKEKHCEKCLVKEIRPGVKIYYHHVLEAKLIFYNGLSLSLETEFIEKQPDKKKQDCEYNAFFRLAKRLKKTYPQLKICLSMDSLYANRPVMDLCKQNRWSYVITFKKGSMPDVYDWYGRIKKLHPENKSKLRFKEGIIQHYAWVSPLEHYSEDRIFHVLECDEDKRNGKKTKYVWLTDIPITQKNHQQIANYGGRLRWKIENQGFNMQKNGGYRLEHLYSTNERAMKNFYLLLQIAHFINQLIEKGSLLKKSFANGLGSIRNIAHQLLEDLRCIELDPSCLNVKFQIRMDSS